MVALAGLTPLIFAGCLYSAHRVMNQARTAFLQRINEHVQPQYEILRKGLDQGDVADDAAAGVLRLDALHAFGRRLPVWPINTQVVMQVLVSVALPLALLGVQVLVSEVVESGAKSAPPPGGPAPPPGAGAGARGGSGRPGGGRLGGGGRRGGGAPGGAPAGGAGEACRGHRDGRGRSRGQRAPAVQRAAAAAGPPLSSLCEWGFPRRSLHPCRQTELPDAGHSALSASHLLRTAPPANGPLPIRRSAAAATGYRPGGYRLR